MNEDDLYAARPLHPDLKPKPGKAAGEQASKPKRQRRSRWTLARLSRACRFAPAVWLALQELARGRSTCTPTRETLAELIGIRRHKSISAGLTALEKAGWIEREHVPKFRGGRQTATLLRVRFLCTKRRGRKTPHTVRA